MTMRSGYKKCLGLLVLILCAALNLAAQDEGARIYRVEGADFAVTMNGGRTVFPADAAGREGVLLERSGIVHTGPETFLELQLLPSGTVVKLSENTSLVYNGIDGTGNSADLGLLYGRIRVVAGTNAAGTIAAVIRGGGVSARMTGGDLGIDYVLEPGTRGSAARPLFRVYAFRGGAELFPYGQGGPQAYFGGVESLSAAEGESLFIDISGGHTFAEKGLLGEDIRNYWILHNFSASSSPLAMPDTAIALAPKETPVAAAPAPVEKIVYVERPGPSIAPNNRSKNLALGLGLILTASAVAAQGIAYSRFDASGTGMAHNIYQAAYVPMGLGLLCILTGVLYNPSPER